MGTRPLQMYICMHMHVHMYGSTVRGRHQHRGALTIVSRTIIDRTNSSPILLPILCPKMLEIDTILEANVLNK